MRWTTPQDTGRLVAYSLVAAVLLIFVVFLPATGALDVPPIASSLGTTLEATVVDVSGRTTQVTSHGTVVSDRVVLRLDGGEEVSVDRQYVEGDVGRFDVTAGDRVLVSRQEGATEGRGYLIVDRVRRAPLALMALSFGALVLAVGGRRGVWSLVGLVASMLVIVRFIVPAILAGGDPVTVSIVGSLVVMMTTLTIAHGISRVTAVALAGTAVSLLLTGALAAGGIRFAALTGVASDEAAQLQVLAPGIDVHGLLLAGIIVGALGVLDDVTTTQASTVFELKRAGARLGRRQLYLRGMNVGRDHIAATVNTLMLAYAGAALPLLMILASQPEPVGMLINRDNLATEVVRTLVGSIGIVAAVPVTTALAALVAGGETPDPDSEAAEPLGEGRSSAQTEF
ncbi:MAG: YibE/F family protein [Dehalococcoidia bacterium]|nr:YibE/F family protein [Dehalococcoidia bacterium]